MIHTRTRSGDRLWLALLLLCILLSPSWAQVNISGKPGLLYIPSATLSEDGALRIGVAYNPIKYGLGRPGRNADRIIYANLTVVPRLEVNVNISQLVGDNSIGLGDRQLDIRYLVLKEKRWRPSVAVVMSSPFTIDAALLTHVVVATKAVKLSEAVKAMVTLGVGSPYFIYRDVRNLASYNVFEGYKWQKKSEYRDGNNYLVGFFGGVQLDFHEKAGLLLEYDSNYINVGAYTTLLKHWQLQAGLINFDQVTLGTSYVFPLLKPSKRLKKLYEKD